MNSENTLDYSQITKRASAEERILSLPKIVLLDDDAMFCRNMKRAARKLSIPLETYAELGDIPQMMAQDFDLTILDFDLGAITGAELAAFLKARIGGIPVVMVSYTKREPVANAPWPDIVQGFVLKDVGPEAILNYAVNAYDSSQIKSFKKAARERRKRLSF